MAKTITVADIAAAIGSFTKQEVEKVKYIARKELKTRKAATVSATTPKKAKTKK